MDYRNADEKSIEKVAKIYKPKERGGASRHPSLWNILVISTIIK